jgi:signal transduction histidine kinase
VRALEATIDEIIRAARSHTPRRPESPVDLVAATRSRLAFWSVLADNEGRAMTVALDVEPCPIALPEADLDAAIDALVGNVFAHTPEGTSFRVAVRAASDNAPPALIVEDDGPGLVDVDLVERGASGAGSTGLGLDIARRTAESTGGRLAIGRAQSGGARVELVLGGGGHAGPRDASLVSRR